MKTLIALAERGLFPTWLIAVGVRYLCSERLAMYTRKSLEENAEMKRRLIDQLCASPLAVDTEKANEQHYELPAGYFERVLGARLKYSACTWSPQGGTLDEAEVASLQLVVERAEIEDGMAILELGCGWGSLSLWMAEHFPQSRILY